MFIVGSPAQASFLARACEQGLSSPFPTVSVNIENGRRGSARTSVVTKATRAFEAVAVRSRKRRRGRRGSGDSSDDEPSLGGSDGDSGSFNWGGSGGGSGGSSGGGWNWNGGSRWGSGGYSGGAYSGHAIYECLWFWQLLCGCSLLQALHFVLAGDRKANDTAAATASVTMAVSVVRRARTTTRQIAASA